MENQPKLNNSKDIIALLTERFPLCFTTEGEARPLKIGIFQDLVARMQEDEEFSKTRLRVALRRYTSSWRYLHGVKVGAERVDLDGNACGTLEEQHVEHAQQQLQEAKARVQTQRAEQAAKKRAENGDKPRRPATKKPAAKKPTAPRKTDATAKAKSDAVKAQKEAALAATKPVENVSDLTLGQNVTVNLANSPTQGTVVEIVKDGARVQLANGLAMVVRAEHLRF